MSELQTEDRECVRVHASSGSWMNLHARTHTHTNTLMPAVYGENSGSVTQHVKPCYLVYTTFPYSGHDSIYNDTLW